MTGGERESVVRFGTYNIRNGKNGRFESVLQGMYQRNIDLGVFQDIKVTDGLHIHTLAVYSVFATDAPSQNSGGIELFYRYDMSHFQVKAMQQHGPNIPSFQVVSR